MDDKKLNNPGSGNHFTEIHQSISIGSVGVYNNATNIYNTYQDGKLKETKSDAPVVETAAVRKEIVLYVGKTLCLVVERWKPVYMDLWNDILDLREVAALVYDRGRQQKTVFNRKLVANIIHYLGDFTGVGAGIYGDYSATTIVKELEGTKDCSTRTELGLSPSKETCDAIKPLLKKHGIITR